MSALSFRRSALALALASTLAAPALAGGPTAQPAAKASAEAYVQDELLIQFRPGVMAAVRDAVLQAHGLKLAKVLRQAARAGQEQGELTRVKLPSGKLVPSMVKLLSTIPEIRFAEPNWILTKQAKTIDPYYSNGSLWGMYGDTSPLKQNAFGSQAAEALAAGKRCSGNVIVGVIDEGMMVSHPDLAANVWSNPFEIPDNGIDDDGNGLIDDVNGWDFFEDNNSVFDGVGDDHGTHVSGTIAAVAQNGIGVAGVCPKAKLISAKFLGPSGGSTADGIEAIDYITDLKLRHGLNIVATNNSWGGGSFSQAMQDAIQRAGDANILFVAAAGNGNLLGVGQNNDSKPHYPSAYPNDNIIAVASITSTGARSGFSNYGLTTVDIGAPGSGIWSTVPKSSGGTITAGYASYDGTSMATPHVTGAVALYASLHPGSTAAQIKAAILGAAVATPSLAGKTVTGGRLDVSGF